MPAIGDELNFPMDTTIGKLPSIIDGPSESVVVYLRHIQNDMDFSRRLLVWLLDDRCTIHRES